MDIVIWGLVGTWVQPSSAQSLILTALVFWEIILRTSVEITSSLLEELWGHSLLNLFASPIKISEWVLALMLSGFIKATITFSFSTFLVLALFKVNPFDLGWTLPLFWVLFALIGCSTGFLGAGFIIYAGHRLESLAWQIVWSFAPISTVFYPLEALPVWLQKVANFFPMAYVFESMRIQMTTGLLPKNMLFIGSLLTLFYLALSIFFFRYMFRKSLNKGLSRLG